MKILLDPEHLEQLSRRARARLMSVEPGPLKTARNEVSQIIQLALDTALQNLDIVTRQEFAVQTKLLERTRARLDALQAHINEVEKNRESDQS